MENKDLNLLTDQELLLEKKKMNNSKLMFATIIGFLGGILIFGVVAWVINPDRKIGFLIPMSIPVVLIYRMMKKPNENKDLEAILKERGLN
jgi:hypothetical protein